MKSEYNINALKRKGHPLREKVKRGEITLVIPSIYLMRILMPKWLLLTPMNAKLSLIYVI